MRQFLISAAKILLGILACAAAGFCIVFPLWKWATARPVSYTWAALAVITAAAVCLLYKRCRVLGKRTFFLRLTRILVMAAGICGCVVLVLHQKRILAPVCLLAAAVLCALISIGARKLER